MFTTDAAVKAAPKRFDRDAHHALARRAAAEKRDGLVSRALHVRHCHDGDIVTDMQTVRGRVKADVKRRGFFAELVIKIIFVHRLFDKAALFENVECVLVGCHSSFYLTSVTFFLKTSPSARMPRSIFSSSAFE